VENENTNELDNDDELNIRHIDKKQKVESGYWIVRLNLMPNENVANSYGETNFIQTEADPVSNAISLNRPNITQSLIETPVLEHSSGRVARSVKADSNEIETTSSSLHKAQRKRKLIVPDSSDKKFKNVIKVNYYLFFSGYLLIYYYNFNRALLLT